MTRAALEMVTAIAEMMLAARGGEELPTGVSEVSVRR